MPFDDRLHVGTITYPRLDGQDGTSEVSLLVEGFTWETDDPRMPAFLEAFGVSTVRISQLGVTGLVELYELAKVLGGDLETVNLDPEPGEDL